MQQFRNLRNILIHGLVSILVISCCFLGFESNQYQKQLCGHVQNALRLTLVTLLERKVVVALQTREHQDQVEEEHLKALARVHQNVSLYDSRWASVLHQQSLELQGHAEYVSKTVIPVVKEAFHLQEEQQEEESKAAATFSPEQQPQEGHHWCEVTMIHSICLLVSNTASLADTTPDQQQIQQHEHWHMVQQQKHNATEAWVLQVLNNQTTAYAKSASALEEFAVYLQKKAIAEHVTAEQELQAAQVLRNEEDALQKKVTELEQDMRKTSQARDIAWDKAVWDGYMVYATGMAALCLAISLVVALVTIALHHLCGTSTDAWHLQQQPDRHLLLRRCIIAWFVVGVVSDATSLGDGSCAFFKGLTSSVVAERASWIVSVASIIGAAQSILLHDFFHSETSWGRHLFTVLLDWAKFSVITILHILTFWLAGYGLIPFSVVSILLNTTTQFVLVGIYVIVMLWEPPSFPTGESTTVQTAESDESTPLQATTKIHPKYVNDASSAVIYLGGYSENGSTISSYTSSAHAGWLASWDVLLFLSLLRVAWITVPCIQLCPTLSGIALSLTLLTSVAVACRWSENGGYHHQRDDRLPQTIVV